MYKNKIYNMCVFPPVNRVDVVNLQQSYFSSRCVISDNLFHEALYHDFRNLDDVQLILNTFEHMVSEVMLKNPKLFKHFPYELRRKKTEKDMKLKIYRTACFLSEYYGFRLGNCLAVVSYHYLWGFRDFPNIPGTSDVDVQRITDFLNIEKNMKIINNQQSDQNEDLAFEILNLGYHMYFENPLDVPSSYQDIVTDFEHGGADYYERGQEIFSCKKNILEFFNFTSDVLVMDDCFTNETVKNIFPILVSFHRIPYKKAAAMARHYQSKNTYVPGVDDKELLEEINQFEIWLYGMHKQFWLEANGVEF